MSGSTSSDRRASSASEAAETPQPAPVRVLWLQPRTPEPPKSQPLQHHLCAQGIGVATADWHTAAMQPWRDFDLIVICVPHPVQDQIPPLLEGIRTRSYVPVVLLVEAPARKWSLDMVTAGADAVMDDDTPASIIFARWTALLRRWRPDAFIAPYPPPLRQ